MENKILIFETAVIETKTSYTISGTKEMDTKKPSIKKILFGVEIKKPTSFRIYKYKNGMGRTWVFGDLEINPGRFDLDKISK